MLPRRLVEWGLGPAYRPTALGTYRRDCPRYRTAPTVLDTYRRDSRACSSTYWRERERENDRESDRESDRDREVCVGVGGGEPLDSRTL